MNIEELKYPLGEFRPLPFSEEIKEQAINTIKNFPSELEGVVSNLSYDQLATAYRPGGWTIRQVIHHCADSHMNAFIRFKLALTEVNPTIKPYAEAEWAKMKDYDADINDSLILLKSLHIRWENVLKNMNSEDFNKTYFHPESSASIPLSNVLQLYQWHSKHHLKHITNLIEREGWAI